VPQVAWIHPPGVFLDVVTIWPKLGVTKDPDTGALTEGWPTLGFDWGRSFVTPITEADQPELAARYQSAQWFAYLMRQDDGTLPDVRTDDHVTWTDQAGVVHTLNVLYAVNEGGMGICRRAICTELAETG
jgi:hypothetical protein